MPKQEVRLNRNVSITLRKGQIIPLDVLKKCQLNFLVEKGYAEIVEPKRQEKIDDKEAKNEQLS